MMKSYRCQKAKILSQVGSKARAELLEEEAKQLAKRPEFVFAINAMERQYLAHKFHPNHTVEEINLIIAGARMFLRKHAYKILRTTKDEKRRRK